mmetsp:Transcript_10902/g.27509  ORF Transcript_10902/g.27509 Transcript_10902/m.27509 type:complete len:166 (+) Transcript_10902:60-557(+)
MVPSDGLQCSPLPPVQPPHVPLGHSSTPRRRLSHRRQLSASPPTQHADALGTLAGRGLSPPHRPQPPAAPPPAAPIERTEPGRVGSADRTERDAELASSDAAAEHTPLGSADAQLQPATRANRLAKLYRLPPRTTHVMTRQITLKFSMQPVLPLIVNSQRGRVLR